MYQPAMPDTANHASTRRQAPTDGGGGEKESSVPELCSLESVCGQACVYRPIARCVFTTIFINHKYSCSGVFNFILPSQAPYEDIQEVCFQVKLKLNSDKENSKYPYLLGF